MATILFAITLGVYQSFAALFITKVIFIFYSMSCEDSAKWKKIWKMVFQSIIVFLCGIVLYFAISKLIIMNFHLSNGYLLSQVGWMHNNFLSNILNIIKTGVLIYFGFFFRYWQFGLLNTLIFVFTTLKIFRKLKAKKYQQVIGLCFCLAAPLIMTIVLGNREPIRAMFGLPYTIAFLLITYEPKSKLFDNLIILSIVINLIIMLLCECSDYIRFRNDVKLANDIYETIEPYVSTHKLVFVGVQEENNLLLQGEIIGHSFFNFDNSSVRAIGFLTSLGYNIMPDFEFIDEATYIMKDKPVYPNPDSTIITDTHILIKLS